MIDLVCDVSSTGNKVEGETSSLKVKNLVVQE